MRLRSHRQPVPDDVRAALPLERGERILAGSADSEGRWVVGTDRSLYLANGTYTEIPWERVEHATWDRDDAVLVVEEVADFGEPHPRHTVGLDDPRRLLELVRERVTASILLTRHLEVEGSGGIKVVARRSPVRKGEVQFAFWLAPDLDPDAPGVREATRAGVERAREELGLS